MHRGVLGAAFEVVLFDLRYEEGERMNHAGYLGKGISGRGRRPWMEAAWHGTSRRPVQGDRVVDEIGGSSGTKPDFGFSSLTVGLGKGRGLA